MQRVMECDESRVSGMDEVVTESVHNEMDGRMTKDKWNGVGESEWEGMGGRAEPCRVK